MVVAVVAIVLVTRDSDAHGTLDATVAGLAALAGLGFGLFFVALEQTDEAAGLWPRCRRSSSWPCG